MRLTETDTWGKLVRKYNFEPVESKMFQGEYYNVKCVKCGKIYKIKELSWQIKHYFKCSA